MHVLYGMADFLRQFLNQPAFFLGLVALIGLVLQKKRPVEVVKGTLHTVIGLLVFTAGSVILIDGIGPINEMLQVGWGVSGVYPLSETAFAVTIERLAHWIVPAFALGFAGHLLLVRLLPRFHCVYLTAHIMLFISSMLVVGLHYGLRLDGFPLVAVTAVLCAAYWTVMPQWTYDAYARHLADGKFTLGHHVHLSVALASEIGRLVGEPENDADQLDLPEVLTLFQDVTINAAITLPVFFFMVGVAVGLPAVRQQAGDQAWWFYLLTRGLRFSAGLTVMLLGIKEFLEALVPAFEGWAERVIPGAIPGLDVPVFFPSSPVGMMLGFIGGAVGMFVVSLVLFFAESALFVFPSLIVAVFEMGTMGVFANERGGWKAALLAGFVGGVLLSVGAFILQPVTAPVLAGTGAQYGSLDSAYVFGPLMWLLRLLGQMLGVSSPSL